MHKLRIGEIDVDVLRKDIKNVHLSVHPPTGRVRIAAPLHSNLNTLRVFAISKLSWIKKQQTKLLEQDRESPREYLRRESHYVWGERYLLQIIEGEESNAVELVHKKLILHLRDKWDADVAQELLETWYREQVKTAVPGFIAKWAPRIGVIPSRFFVQRMKTKWGSCNHVKRTIRLNTDLARKPPVCLEYVTAHELIHLLEPTHNERFQKLMDRFLPTWKTHRDELNRLPVRHENWTL